MQYIKINEVTNMSFYQIPKVLFTNAYKDMSLGAKVVYSFLKDRVSLSIKNNWVDESGNVFIYYARDKMAQDLNISERSVRKYMKELAEYELIKEVRQGLTKPNKIYVGIPIDIENTMNGKIYRSVEANNAELNRNNMPTNYTELNKTKNNETESLQSLYKIGWSDEVEPYIKSYLEIRNMFRNKRHKRIREKYVKFINDAVNKLIGSSVDLDMFTETVEEYFEDLPENNDGDIVYFLQVSQPRYFMITGDSERIMKEDYI